MLMSWRILRIVADNNVDIFVLNNLCGNQLLLASALRSVSQNELSGLTEHNTDDPPGRPALTKLCYDHFVTAATKPDGEIHTI